MKVFTIQITEEQARYIAAACACSQRSMAELTGEEYDELELIWGMIHSMIDEGNVEDTHCFHL